jgi:metal-responsive CopG/Arc/MetJ family transcriptional regulator
MNYIVLQRITMQIVSVKFQEDILKKMDQVIQESNYNSRTEFIREAVRNKLSAQDKEELLKKFLSLRGKAKVNTTDEENEKTREEVGRELRAELEKRFNISPRA